MSDRFRCRTMPYLPRYKPLSSANRRPRYLYPDTTSSSRELIYYIDGRPARVINSYQTHNVSPSNKPCRIFLSCPSLGHCLTRVTGNTSCDDSSSSHVYTNPRDLQNGPSRQRNDDGVVNCQDIFHSSSCCLDMTQSESGVSVGESEDWSVFGRESDSISQRSSNSWSTFCEGSGDNDTDRIEMDNFNGPGFLGDMPRDSPYSCQDDDNNFVNDSHYDHMPNHKSHNRENSRYSHNWCGRDTPTNVSPSWHVEKADQFSELLPGILDESIKYIEQAEPTSAHAVIGAGGRDKSQSQPRDSVVCDTSCSSELPFGKLDNCRYLLQLDIPKHETKHEDLSCGRGLSDDSCVLDSKISPLSCDDWVAGTSSNVEFSRTHGNLRLTNAQSDNVTRRDGDTKGTKTHCDIELTRTCSDLEEKGLGGDQEMRIYCSRANSLVISSDENTDNGGNGQYPLDYKTGQVVLDGDLGIRKRNQLAGDTLTDRFTNWEDEENEDRVRLYESGVSQVCSSTNRCEIVRRSSGMFSGDRNDLRDDSHTDNDLPCSSDMVDDDDVIRSSVSDLSLSVGCVVDTDSVNYGITTADASLAKCAWLSRGECSENIRDTNNTLLLLPPEMVNQENFNKWDLSGIREQRRSNIPEGRVIDLASESSDVRAQQTPLQQSSVCHRDYATVDWRINNNNTSAENLIDSSQADTNRLPYRSGFWEETQSSQTVSGKTENKYKHISNIAEPSHALHVKQRIAGVTQQLKNQLVISFDSCDPFEKSDSCVYCGERTERCLYGVVCANCVFRRYYNNSLSDDEKVINNCYRREDIDSCAGIPASILDESIKHAGEKRRTNKGTQHVGHFCAGKQGVGPGKIDEIIRYNRLGEQDVNKSSSKDSHTVDDQRSRGTETVGISLLSILESDKDKSGDNVLSQDSNTQDTVPRINESCQIVSWNNLFVGLAAQDAVSIDKTPADTLFSERPSCVSPDRLSSARILDVPSDFINSASSPNNQLRTGVSCPPVSPVIHSSLVFSIPSRHTTSYIQTMKEKIKESCSIQNTNSSTSDVSVVADLSNRSRKHSSFPAGLFTIGCHVNPLDNLHAQLSLISGKCGSAGSEDSGYVGSDVYQDHAEATCSWKLGTVSDAKRFYNIPEDHSFKETTLNLAAGKDNLGSFSRSRVWNELSPKETHSFVVSDTREEYDNADTYITAETHRESRFLPRSYHQMPLFKYGQAKVSSLWTVPEEPENVCEETFPDSSSTLPVDASTIRNTDKTTLADRKPYKTENTTALMECNSTDNTSYEKCNLSLMSTMSLGENCREFDMAVNQKSHLSAGSSLMGNIYDSCDVKSGILYSRLVKQRSPIKCGYHEVETCNRFLVGEDENNTTSLSANHPLDTIRQECGDSPGSDRRERNDLLSEGKLNKHSPGCEEVPNENFTDNQSVLDRLSQSLSQISKQDVDSVYYRKSLFREDTTDSDAESQQCHSSSYESDLMCSISYSSDLDSSTSSDSIRHTHFSSSGKAEFKDRAFDDYDYLTSTRTIGSDQTEPQSDLNEIGKHSDISIKDFDKIVDELNTSMLHIQEIAEMMLPQNQSTTDCEDLYQAFTNEESEKQQNHGCIVLEDEDAIKYRFKRFLKKSHSKRKKGLKILKFFSRLGCVSGMGSPPTGSPLVSRKQPGKCEKCLNAETQLLPEQTLPDPIRASSKSYHHLESRSMPLAGNRSSPSSSNQSLDSTPSKADSAYSSFSESTEATANNLGILSMSDSQVHSSSDHPLDSVNMDSSIVSCSSSVDFSSSSSDVGVIHVSALDSENIRTTSALKVGALTRTDIMSEVFDELNNREGEIDTALLYNMRYGHTPAKVDKTWG